MQCSRECFCLGLCRRAHDCLDALLLRSTCVSCSGCAFAYQQQHTYSCSFCW